MASLNSSVAKPAPVYTHEGSRAIRMSVRDQLVRMTMNCMLWEDGFYVDGKSAADVIVDLVHRCTLAEAASVAIEARNNMKLRHVPLLICRAMARHPRRTSATGTNHTSWISKTLAEVIQRPDELSEFLAIYWKDGKQPLSKQVKLGLAKAFQKFNEYSLAKYNREKDIMLRDVLFLCHSKPADVPRDAAKWNKAERAHYEHAVLQRAAGPFVKKVRPQGFTAGELLYGRVVYNQLATPDTWEVELSAKGNNHESWTRLLNENKLADLAFLRNLRNMREAGVSESLIVANGNQRKWGRVLPFRFIAAARMVPSMEPALENWMLKCLEGSPKLPGKTILLIDVSGSMSASLSAKSDLNRLDAGKGLAMLLREVCENVEIYTFRENNTLVPARRGFALGDIIGNAAGGTRLGSAVSKMNSIGYDRLIVISDEESSDVVPPALSGKLAYMINVAQTQHGVGFGPWLRIAGFSESIVDYIQAYEATL